MTSFKFFRPHRKYWWEPGALAWFVPIGSCTLGQKNDIHFSEKEKEREK